MPLRTLNPPHLRRVARAAAVVRLREIQAITGELLKIRLAAQEAAKAAPPATTTRGKQKA